MNQEKGNKPAMDKGRIQEEVLSWLKAFEHCVQTRDFESGRELFDSKVCGFGTVVEQFEVLGDLVEKQWRPVWENTRDFEFLENSVRVFGGSAGGPFVVTSLWRSFGVRDGENFPRRGRCTIVLTTGGRASAGLRAVHTHFSKTPDGGL